MSFNVILKLNYDDQLDEGLFDSYERLKKFFSNFITQAKKNEIILRATKDELIGIYQELESFMKKLGFNKVKDDDYVYDFVKDTEIVKVTKPQKMKGDLTISLMFN
jgi:UDP-N-acetylmuramate-alanine ligase